MLGRGLVALGAMLLHIGLTQAAPVQFAFTGVVDNDPFGVFDSATVEGTYTFDTAIPQVLSTPNSGGFEGSGGTYAMRMSFTGTLDASVSGPFVADTLNISINNDFPGPLDQYLVTGRSSVDGILTLELIFEDFTGTAFGSTALPLLPPSLAAFTSTRFALFAGTVDNPIEAEGAITNLICVTGCAATVPEPGALWLSPLALLALAVVRRRDRI